MKTILHLTVIIFLFISSKKTNAGHLLLENMSIIEHIDINTDNDMDKIAYVVTIDENNHRLAMVSMTFQPRNNILYMAPGANQLPNRWATFVQNLKVVDGNGNTILVEGLSDARWEMKLSHHDKITVSYEVRLDHEDHKWSGGIDGAAYATNWGVFYTGRSLFILNGEDWNNITTDFIMPSEWHVTTPFDAVKNTKNTFTINNQTALMQSMLFAGTHEEISFKRDDFELVFALGGEEIIAQKEEFKNLAEGVLDYYIALMGGIPNPSPDNKFNKSIVIINSSTLTDGEQIGNNISMLIEKNGDNMSQMIARFMFAHEFFHLWNGKSFRPNSNDSEWFKEGFTNYYTLKSLHHVGFIDDSSYLKILNSLFFQRYTNDDGVGKLSMTMGEEKHDHWGLIYGGGLFVGISQDMIIREATDNKKSVDDLMRGLFQKYGGTDNGYSLNELRESLSKLSGIDQTEFFNNYVIGTARIPIDAFLSMAGLDSKIEDGVLKIERKSSANELEENITRGLFGKMDPN